MPLGPGTRLGPYEILSALGARGMVECHSASALGGLLATAVVATATSVVSIAYSTISAAPPSHSVGGVNMVVTNPSGLSGMQSSGHTYATLTVPSVRVLYLVLIVGATSSSYTTPALISNTRYWARVSSGSGYANSNAATISVAFTDSAMVSGTTVVKVVHFTELRNRINALFVFGSFWRSVRFPKLDVAGSIPVSRSIRLRASEHYRATAQCRAEAPKARRRATFARCASFGWQAFSQLPKPNSQFPRRARTQRSSWELEVGSWELRPRRTRAT